MRDDVLLRKTVLVISLQHGRGAENKLKIVFLSVVEGAAGGSLVVRCSGFSGARRRGLGSSNGQGFARAQWWYVAQGLKPLCL